MIIWGSKGKTKILGRGQFFCPRCQQQRVYHRVGVGKYFTLYFIPLFETKKLGEYIECQTCQTPFETSVLDFNKEAIESIRQFVEIIKTESSNGIPVNILYNQIVDAGLDGETANNIIAMATNGKLKVCTTCRLVYTATLKFCSGCGRQLEAPS